MDKPNIIYILADDLGYGDISYLNERCAFETPNFDKLAEEGIAYTDSHSTSAVCTPSRYGILTGRYCWRSSLKQGELWGLNQSLIEKDRETIGTYLQRQGYKTACIGKWHLGLGWQMIDEETPDYELPLTDSPVDHGFDYFYGIPASLDIPPYVYIENHTILDRPTRKIGNFDSVNNKLNKKMQRMGDADNEFETEGVLPNFTKRVLDKIEEYKNNPFFIYFPLNAPHTPIVPTDEFKGKSRTNEYGDFVLMCDDVVKQVVEKLDELGLSDNTMVVFTSDNGCSPMANYPELAQYGHNPSYIFRGTKADIYEDGHRIPLLIKWPKSIKAGQMCDETVSLSDFLATMADYFGEPIEEGGAPDSVSHLPVWQGNDYQKPLREYIVHHSVNGSFSIRKGKWKLELCPGSGGWSLPIPDDIPASMPKYQLYNMETDVRERYNVYEENLDIAQELEALLNECIDNE